MAEQRRITVVNQHTNNYGDDAAGVALVERCLSELQATQVDVFYIWDGGDGGLPVDDERVRHHRLPVLAGSRDARPALARATLRQLLLRKGVHPGLRGLASSARDSDFVLVSPAGANIGIYKDWTYLFVLVGLVLNGIRPIFFQNTIGRSNSRIFDAVARYVLRRSDLYVRESASQRWLASEGLTAYLGVDTGLLLDIEPQGVTDPVIAVVPTNLSGWHRDFKSDDDGLLWRDALARGLAISAAEHGLGVRIVPHLYGSQAEPAEIERFIAALAKHGCPAEIAPVSTLSGYISELGRASVVVSMRYHGLILSARQGVPCVSLAYENNPSSYEGLPNRRRSAGRCG
nr:polysaccharide pyruvyl transferase family protein [Microbacterium barkeri]